MSHVLYADDVIIFCRSDARSLKHLQDFRNSYGKASGQIVSRDKSKFFLGKAAAHRTAHVKSILNFQEEIPFTYLGVPIFRGKPRRIHFQTLADKAKSKLEGWKGKLLSMAGRVQLVQSVVQSLLLYSLSICKWPSSLLKLLNVWCRNFIWSGDCNIRKRVTLSWDKVCVPKSEGVLGLRDFRILNKAALLNLSWKILTTTTPWSSFFKARYNLSSSSFSTRYNIFLYLDWD